MCICVLDENVLHCVVVCCSVLQCVAVCCSVSQCVAVCRSVLFSRCLRIGCLYVWWMCGCWGGSYVCCSVRCIMCCRGRILVLIHIGLVMNSCMYLYVFTMCQGVWGGGLGMCPVCVCAGDVYVCVMRGTLYVW